MKPHTTVPMTGWRDAAACTRVDPEIFYPVDDRPDALAVRTAKQVCAGCPVRKVCLADVMAWEDPARRWGITAGLTPAERTARFVRECHAATRPGEVAA
jgi:WhiB family transcriptional regulator, redox-sensing transcriptional regulator